MIKKILTFNLRGCLSEINLSEQNFKVSPKFYIDINKYLNSDKQVKFDLTPEENLLEEIILKRVENEIPPKETKISNVSDFYFDIKTSFEIELKENLTNEEFTERIFESNIWLSDHLIINISNECEEYAVFEYGSVEFNLSDI